MPRIGLALQGGGAHGAFTWGVLDAILEDGSIPIHAVSGTSAGALNAAALVTGLDEGGPAMGRERLRELWRTVAERSPLGLAEGNMPFLPPFPRALVHATLEKMKLLGQLVSPYHPVLPTTNALRAVVDSTIDIERLRRQTTIPTFVSATRVDDGTARVFTGTELTTDALLASACLPDIFRAVTIDGVDYWDGGYMGNPILTPLYVEADVEDVVIVQVTPFRQPETPRSMSEIIARVNDITFNASLMRDLRTIATVQRLSGREEEFESEQLKRIARLRVHVVSAGDALTAQGIGKMDTRYSELSKLRDLGRMTFQTWLDEHRDDIGKRSSATELLAAFV